MKEDAYHKAIAATLAKTQAMASFKDMANSIKSTETQASSTDNVAKAMELASKIVNENPETAIEHLK